jgi:hypothetical protein
MARRIILFFLDGSSSTGTGIYVFDNIPILFTREQSELYLFVVTHTITSNTIILPREIQPAGLTAGFSL